MEKLYVTYADVHALVAKTAAAILATDWRPDLIVAVASGGFVPARIFRTYLQKEIHVVSLKRYPDRSGESPTAVPVKVQWLEDPVRVLAGKRVLVVDEVDDTRVTLGYCVRELLKAKPAEIRVAVLHQKRKPKESDYPAAVAVVYEGAAIPDVWIKYPWDAVDQAEHERLAAAQRADAAPGA
jgi:hypoxanthine phosphoribosyltransferase